MSTHTVNGIRYTVKLGFWRFLWVYVRDLVRFGYKNHPMEREAHDYAYENEARFPHLP
jgi:hypothetical protein